MQEEQGDREREGRSKERGREMARLITIIQGSPLRSGYVTLHTFCPNIAVLH